jgi:hypothetical protein
LAFGGFQQQFSGATGNLGMDQLGQIFLGDLNTARRLLGGCGATNTAALLLVDIDLLQQMLPQDLQNLGMELAWTEVNDLNTARYALAGTGTNTVALAFGGQVTPSFVIVNSKRRILEWNILVTSR